MRFLFSPTRFIGHIIKQPAYRRQLRNSHVIAGPHSLGFKGGIYNPGSLPTSDCGAVLLAKGQLCHWWDAVGIDAHLYFKGSPVVFTLDKEMAVKSSHVVQTLQKYPVIENVGYEDFRLFRYNGEIWSNHSIVPLVQRNKCVWSFKDAKQCLSHLDPSYKTLSFIGYPQLDLSLRPIEKNWLYVEYQGELYMFYSFHPYRVLKLTDRKNLKFTTIIDEPLGSRLADIGGYKTFVSFSTNPIDYDEQHWLLLVHQIEPSRIERCYHHWGVLIDKGSFLPRKITSKPLFSGKGARGRKPGIIYVASVIRREKDFVFFNGEGDAYVTWISVSKDKLNSAWSDIPPDFARQ